MMHFFPTGDEITIRYVKWRRLDATRAQRWHALRHWFRECRCAYCVHATEDSASWSAHIAKLSRVENDITRRAAAEHEDKY
jgi:hypothetical protein